MSEPIQKIDIIEMINGKLENDLITIDDIERNLFTDFYFDSVAMVMVIIAIEDRFDVQIEDNDLTLENFSTVNSIFELLNRTLARK